MSNQPPSTENPTAELTTYFHAPLNLSMRVPTAWNGQLLEQGGLRLLAPPHPLTGYRASMDVVQGAPDGETVAWMEDFFVQVGQRQAETYLGYHIVEEERYALSSGAQVCARWYGWHELETGRTYAQVQALVWIDAERLLLINGATLDVLAERDLPLFRAFLRGLRVIA
ncbi:MAG: hypothetical protein ACKO6N_18330 [Myxococcota bacterium]